MLRRVQQRGARSSTRHKSVEGWAPFTTLLTNAGSPFNVQRFKERLGGSAREKLGGKLGKLVENLGEGRGSGRGPRVRLSNLANLKNFLSLRFVGMHGEATKGVGSRSSVSRERSRLLGITLEDGSNGRTLV